MYSYDLETPGTSGMPNEILLNTGTELFKIRKIGSFPRKPGRMGYFQIKDPS